MQDRKEHKVEHQKQKSLYNTQNTDIIVTRTVKDNLNSKVTC